MPKLIDVLKKEFCVDVSAAVNHTVMLMEKFVSCLLVSILIYSGNFIALL